MNQKLILSLVALALAVGGASPDTAASDLCPAGVGIRQEGVATAAIGSTFRVEVTPHSGGRSGTTGEAEITLSPDEPYIDLSFDGPPAVDQESSATISIFDPAGIYEALIDFEGTAGYELLFWPINADFFSHTFTIVPEYSGEHVLHVWYWDQDHVIHHGQFTYLVGGAAQDQAVEDFLAWIESKGYSQEIVDLYASHSSNALVRREFSHYFSIREGARTSEIIEDFKNAATVSITYHEIVPTDEGATSNLTDSTGLEALERYFGEVYGLEFQFAYQAESVNYADTFGPITYLGEWGDKKWIKLDPSRLRSFAFGYYDQRYYHILHFAAETLMYDGEPMWVADWTGSSPTASFMDVDDYSSKYALGIYAHEWGHGIPLNHMFLSWESESSYTARFFGLEDIMVHSYIGYPKPSLEHRYTSPLVRYALEPESPGTYVDDDTYVQDYNDVISGSWMVTSDFPSTKPLVRIEHVGNFMVAEVGGSFDRNGDAVNYVYRWYQDGALLPDTSNQVDVGLSRDDVDNCPTVENPDQSDTDSDGKGDACDNCANTPNPGQEDADSDGIGDVCDSCPGDSDNDADNDGICVGSGYLPPKTGDNDNCPLTPNSDQEDTDEDGLGNPCDPCPLDPANDIDGDGVCGDVDNCPTVPNPDQEDFDADGLGDVCEDSDEDGCMDAEELPGAPPLKPGSTGPYDPLAWYDFYDVPVPANPPPQPNGPRNQAVTMGDVLAVLKYVGTYDGGPPNPGGVDYNTHRDGDWFDGTRQVAYPDGVLDDWDKEGRQFDRSPSAEPNPPWDAGPPDGAVNMQDVVAVLAQVGLNCAGPP